MAGEGGGHHYAPTGRRRGLAALHRQPQRRARVPRSPYRYSRALRGRRAHGWLAITTRPTHHLRPGRHVDRERARRKKGAGCARPLLPPSLARGAGTHGKCSPVPPRPPRPARTCPAAQPPRTAGTLTEAPCPRSWPPGAVGVGLGLCQRVSGGGGGGQDSSDRSREQGWVPHSVLSLLGGDAK